MLPTMAKAIDHNTRKRMVVMKSMRLFAQMGYSKVSFSTISDATGIARTALYRYFRTKRELFDEAIHEITGTIMIELRDIITRDSPAPVRIKIVCDQVIEEIFDTHEFFLAIFDFVFSMVRVGEDMSQRISLFTDGLKLVFRKLLNEGISTGTIAPSVNPAKTADVLFSVMESAAFRVLLGVDKTPEAAKERFQEAIRTISV